jgi:hypothetical protein
MYKIHPSCKIEYIYRQEGGSKTVVARIPSEGGFPKTVTALYFYGPILPQALKLKIIVLLTYT